MLVFAAITIKVRKEIIMECTNCGKIGTPQVCPRCGFYNPSGVSLPEQCLRCGINSNVDLPDLVDIPVSGHDGTLTNLNISNNYHNKDFYIEKDDFLGAFSYWVVHLSPYDTPDIRKPLEAFNNYISSFITKSRLKRFTYKELEALINEHTFSAIPEIEKLNHSRFSFNIEYKNWDDAENLDNSKPDFICLATLSRNIRYMIMREKITQR